MLVEKRWVVGITICSSRQTNAPTIGGTGTDSGTSRADNSPKQNSEESHLTRQSNAEIECINQDEGETSHHKEVQVKPKELPSSSDLIPLESNYMHGCIVSTDMKPNHRSGIYNKGNLATVTGASFDSTTREIFYTIKPGNNDDAETKLCSEKEVAFAPECPIVYSPTKSFDGESCVEGKVLLVQTKNQARAKAT
jgi:hypothetical protein